MIEEWVKKEAGDVHIIEYCAAIRNMKSQFTETCVEGITVSKVSQKEKAKYRCSHLYVLCRITRQGNGKYHIIANCWLWIIEMRILRKEGSREG